MFMWWKKKKEKPLTKLEEAKSCLKALKKLDRNGVLSREINLQSIHIYNDYGRQLFEFIICNSMPFGKFFYIPKRDSAKRLKDCIAILEAEIRMRKLYENA